MRRKPDGKAVLVCDWLSHSAHSQFNALSPCKRQAIIWLREQLPKLESRSRVLRNSVFPEERALTWGAEGIEVHYFIRVQQGDAVIFDILPVHSDQRRQ